MAKITVTAHDHAAVYQRIPAFARVIYQQSFVNDDGDSVAAGDINGAYFVQVAVTYAGGVTSIPQLTGASALDSTIQTVTGHVMSTCTLALYDAKGAFIDTVFTNIRIPATPTTTSWAALKVVSDTARLSSRSDYVTVEQLNRYVAAVLAIEDYPRNVSDLDDVALTDVTTGDLLVYDSVSGEWKNEPFQSKVGAALEFDSTKNHHVNTGVRWLPNTDYFSCFYEAWVWVQDSGNAAYVFSDGYGGAHNLLFGVSVSGGRVSLSGNFNNGTNANTYGSFRTFGVEEWHHIAVAYSETENAVICYLDGVPSGIITYVGSARNTLSNAGTGICFVGGSDHLNFKGRIKAVRGFEFQTGEIPVPFAQSPVVGPAINKVFRPEKVFRGSLISQNKIVEPTLLLDFSTPTKGTIPDLGGKNHGKRSCNIGELTHDLGNFEGRGVFNDSESNYAEENLPQWVRADFEQPEYSGTAPGTIPAGAILYDDFRRQDVTLAWSTSYNITPGAARTGQTPTLSVGDVGILNECLFDASGTLQSITWECSAANQDVTLARPAVHAYSSASEIFGLLARFTDANNYLWAYCASGNWNVVKRVAGTNTTIASGSLGALASYTTIRLVANGDNGFFYVNGTQLGGTLNIASTGSGTKAGINSYGSALTRYDSILVVAP